MKETWKDVEGFGGFYQISNLGAVKSIPHKVSNGHGHFTTKEKILKPNVLAKGYFQVTLAGSDKVRHSLQVHRLVASAFVENINPSKFVQVNHKDGNKQNNRADNLEWTDNGGNQRHAWATGLQKPHNCGWGTSRLGVCVKLLGGDGTYEFSSLAAAARFCGEKSGANVGHAIRHGYKFHGYEVVKK